MQYIPIQPNLESKTRPKQLLGSLPLDIALPGLHFSMKILDLSANMEVTATNTLAYCCTAIKDEEKTGFMTLAEGQEIQEGCDPRYRRRGQ
jgi:hypothetical protein